VQSKLNIWEHGKNQLPPDPKGTVGFAFPQTKSSGQVAVAMNLQRHQAQILDGVRYDLRRADLT